MQDYEYLIHLLNAYVNDVQPLEKPEEVSFENVYKMSKEHEVGNIAFLSIEKLNNKPEPSLYNDWKIFYYFSVERDSKQAEEYERILSLLHESKIRTVEAQGTVTKTLYPEPFLRMMSDIDLIIDFENFDKAKAILEENGYDILANEEMIFNAKNSESMEFDFHCDFFTEKMHNREERYYKSINSPFEHSSVDENDEYKYILDETYFYLYSVLHTIKHYEISGCGIRRILDLFFLKKALGDKVDTELVNKIIEDNDFKESYDILFGVEEKWFENKEPERDLTSAELDIISSGNHGSEEIFIRNNLKKDKESGVFFPKLRMVMKIFFPSAEYIYLEYPEFREKGYSLAKCRFLRIIDRTKRFRVNQLILKIKKIVKSK